MPAPAWVVAEVELRVQREQGGIVTHGRTTAEPEVEGTTTTELMVLVGAPLETTIGTEAVEVIEAPDTATGTLVETTAPEAAPLGETTPLAAAGLPVPARIVMGAL